MYYPKIINEKNLGKYYPMHLNSLYFKPQKPWLNTNNSLLVACVNTHSLPPSS